MAEHTRVKSQGPLAPLAVEVAEKSDVPLDRVEAILVKAKVVEQVGTRRAESLVIRSLKFSGEKNAVDSGDGPFAFEWNNLDAGLWLVLSKGENQIGKSTILEVMLWALRGSTRGLRPEVRAWIRRVELVFSIGLDWYRVEFDDHENTPTGNVLRTAPGHTQLLATFHDDPQFLLAMERLMMERFALQPIPFVGQQGEVAEQYHHTWNLYAGSMYIEGSHKAILGDVTVAATWWRMLQLFIGMPYSGAQMALRSASLLEEVRSKQTGSTSAASTSRISEIERLGGVIAGYEADLAALRATLPRPEDAPELLRLYTRETMRFARLHQSFINVQHQLSAATAEVGEASAALRRLEEGKAAKRFFAGLNPICCPRCAQPFSTNRLESEESGGNCAVCDRDSPGDDQEALLEAIAAATERLESAKAAEGQMRAQETELSEDLAASKADTEAHEASIRQFDERAGDINRQIELRLGLEHTRGARDQLVALENADTGQPVDSSKTEEQQVLKEAESIADSRAKTAGANLLTRLEDELVEVATRVGFKNLQKVSIAGNGIRLTVSGTPSGFSKQTAGQRLRLRIALVIAMMRLASESGHGHHPGLLFIDSPGSEELSEDDLNAMMTEIRSVCDETKNLQIFVSSARGATLASAVDENRRLWPNDDGYMF